MLEDKVFPRRAGLCLAGILPNGGLETADEFKENDAIARFWMVKKMVL